MAGSNHATLLLHVISALFRGGSPDVGSLPHGILGGVALLCGGPASTTHVMTGAALLGLNFLTTLRLYHHYGFAKAIIPGEGIDGELVATS